MNGKGFQKVSASGSVISLGCRLCRKGKMTTDPFVIVFWCDRCGA